MWIFALDTFKFLAFNRATLRHYGYSNTEFRELAAKELCLATEVDAFVAEAGKPSLDLPPRKLAHHCKKDGSVIEVEMAAQDLVYAGCPARLVLTSVSSALLPGVVDPALVELVVRNLALNARDAMPEGGTLAIGTEVVVVDEARAQRQSDAKPGTYASMTVSDTGCGMTPEIKEQI